MQSSVTQCTAEYIRLYRFEIIRRERGPENDFIMKVLRSLEIWTRAENISVKSLRQDSPLAIALVSSGVNRLIGSFQTSSCPWNIKIHFSTYSWPFRLTRIIHCYQYEIMRARTSAGPSTYFVPFECASKYSIFQLSFSYCGITSTDFQNENKMYRHKEITNFIASMRPLLGIVYQIRCNHSRWKKLN